ncbi:MAG: methionyl-tRNA formyltransferase [Bacteroidetes bacterium]|nr:methionyl-tRNA formyltransferase [Bacteroidota bacterium]
MEKKDFRIVFMGTPEFAVASLEVLVNEGYTIAGVITAPDKPAGRGKKLQSSAVKLYAESKGLPILQPEKLKAESFIEALTALKADLQVVVAFRMLPEVVWDMPPKGTINLHASLLPQYRGAAPINRAIMNGETVTGVSTFFLTHEIDTGSIINRVELPIGDNETAGELHDRMMLAGANLLATTIEQIMTDNYITIPQDNASAPLQTLKSAPKIFKEDCIIEWNHEGNSVFNQIRGLSPYPGAFTYIHSENTDPYQLKIFNSHFEPYEDSNYTYEPGSIVIEGRNRMKIASKDGWIIATEVQQSGRKRMSVADYLRGLHDFNGLIAKNQ